MSNNSSEINTLQEAKQEQNNECSTIVNETVCLHGEIKLIPYMKIEEDIETFYVDNPKIETYSEPCTNREACTFKISQNMCIQIPLVFSITGIAKPLGIDCCKPETGPCMAEGRLKSEGKGQKKYNKSKQSVDFDLNWFHE